MLPPAGAPVQCTRCSHVFTAKPPAPVEFVPPPPSIPRPASASQTMVYGVTQPAPGAAPVFPRVPMTPATSGTMVFGSNPPSQPVPAEPQRSSTQMFGAVGAEAKPADSPRTTQMFGAVKPATTPPGDAPRTTQMFGAVKPAAAAPAADSPRTTQMFGAVKFPETTPTPQQKPPEPLRSSTQMFGAVGTGAPRSPEPQRSSTQMFGAVGSETEQPASQDPGVSDEPPLEQPSRSQTMIFGNNPFDESLKPPAAAKAPESALSAELFGDSSNDEPPAEQPAASRTQIFGNNPFDESVKPPPSDPGRSSTQMFGVPTAPPEPSAPARSSTQMFGVPTSEPSAPSRSSTQMFGVPATDAQPPARSSTQMFGATEKPPQTPPAQDARSSDTLQFGLADIEAAAMKLQPAPSVPPTSERPPTVEVSIDYDAATTAPTRAVPPPEPAPLPVTSAQRPARVELPPERTAPPPNMPFAQPSESTEEAAAANSTGRIKFYSSKPKAGSGGLIVAIVALALVALAGYVAAKTWQKKQRQIPAEFQARLLSAQTLIRADDTDSLRRASAEFSALASTLPRWQEPRAWKALTLALQLDDAKAELARLASDRTRLKQQINRLEDEKDPADWQTRVNVLEAAAVEIEKRQSPIIAVTRQLEQELDGWLVSAEASSQVTALDEVSLLRAQLLAGAVRGADISALVVRYQQLPQAPGGGWDALAQAMRVTHVKSDPAFVSEVSTSLETFRQVDSGFIRLHVVAARVHLLLGDKDKAVAALDTAIALNPAHQLGRAMLESAQRAQ